VAIVGIGVVDDFAGKAELVEDDDAFRLPFDGFDVVQGLEAPFARGRSWD
jgi:hypothetical protein